MPTALEVERLDIDSYPLANPCNRLLDLTGMWKVAYRVESIPMPYSHGRASYPSRLDQLVHVFPGVLIGDVDSDGDAHTDAREGLALNYEEFFEAVLAPVDSGDGTRTVEWVKGDATTWSGLVQVVNFDVRSRDPGAINYSLSLAFPAGRLTAPPPP
jgi:hypothetical protein